MRNESLWNLALFILYIPDNLFYFFLSLSSSIIANSFKFHLLLEKHFNIK